MICCTECFSDKQIKAIIKSCGQKGKCPICNYENVWLFDSSKNAYTTDFEELLSSIIDIYVPESKLADDYPDEEKRSIEQHLLEDWNLFNIDEWGVKQIVKHIIEESWDIDEQLLTQKVGIPKLYDELYLVENSIMGTYEWEDFKKSLRNRNRFHDNHINLEVLREVLAGAKRTIPAGRNFYRARIAQDKEGFKCKEMGAPPDDVATAGRANSKGISCLYLASNKNTTVKEIRANAFDYVTIATFKLKRDVNIVDLSSITHNSPFYANTEKIKFLINEKHLKQIEKDLAKPVSSRDSDLDYLPTQYISDFAKSLGYDGVKYLSTFDKNAYNLALFDVDACSCVYHRTFEIGDLNYKLNKL